MIACLSRPMLWAAATLLLAGCNRQIYNGELTSLDGADSIVSGQTTRADVLKLFGPGQEYHSGDVDALIYHVHYDTPQFGAAEFDNAYLRVSFSGDLVSDCRIERTRSAVTMTALRQVSRCGGETAAP